VVERYGNDRLLHDGLRVEMAMNLEAQRAAQAAMLRGLMEVDHRQGFYGPVGHVEGPERQALSERLARAWPRGAIAPGDYCAGVGARGDDAAGRAVVEVGESRGVLPISGMRWARRPNPEAHYPDALISRVSAALRAGDVVLLRRVERKELVAREVAAAPGRPEAVPEAELLFALEQAPRLQGALVSIEPWTGMVAAMVGGYDFEASEFNRAFQACRQPGSTFKPIVYSAAIEKLDFTPATLLTDAPIVYRDDEGAWKPHNYGESFHGEVTLRTALVRSMNIPTVKIAEALVARFGIGVLGEWARQLGISSPVKRELGSALGSSCVTPVELADAYATLDRYGERRPPLLVKRVLDRDGAVLEDHSDWRDPWIPLSSRMASATAELRRPRVRAVEERAAYLTVHLLREAATVGTGARAAALGKPAAGKTGTTNDSFDTWFIGFTRDLVGAVWLGYDQNESPLGRFETGGVAALPIWLDYMQAALRSRPQPEFPVPEGVVLVAVDPDTGQPAPPDRRNAVEMPFKQGTEPAAAAEPAARKTEEREFFLQQ
jgi:penicillin-binding protein 1A